MAFEAPFYLATIAAKSVAVAPAHGSWFRICRQLGAPRIRTVFGSGEHDHTKTKARSPQTNGICERFHRTMLEEFYRVTFRKKMYASLEQLQQDADEWINFYNQERAHSGRYCYGKIRLQTFSDSRHLAQEKQLELLAQPSAVATAT